jgi:serine/threonine-protein kinase
MLHDSPSESGPLLPPSSQSEDIALDDSQYQVLGYIAKGGVGVVYKARDKNLGREVALKILRSDRVTSGAHVAERLVEEAQVGGQLQHPGVVPVYSIGIQKDGRPHFAMKLIKGSTFSQLLQDRSDPQQDQPTFLAQFEQLCYTMAYCHARGVVHRDLKPSNIMVGSFGEVLVVDWGFGKVLARDARGQDKSQKTPARDPVSVIATLRTAPGHGSHSLAGSIMGTPAYMPPEQALGQVDDLDERADVFALGSVLAEILTGEPAYVGEPADVLVMAAQGRLDEAFERLSNCEADNALIELCRDCLAPMRTDRPRHAGVIADRLHEHFSGIEERERKAKVEAAKAHARGEELRAKVQAERLQAEKERAAASKERIKVERAEASAKELRQQNLFNRQRRKRTFVLASALTLAVVVGGGAFAIISAADASATREQRAAFATSFRKAMDLAGNQRWGEASAAANASLALVGDDQPDQKQFVERRVKEWNIRDAREKAAVEKKRKDSEMLASLQELRDRTAERYDARTLDSDYVAAFSGYGIDLAADPATAGKTIRESAIAIDMVDALDTLTILRRTVAALKGTDADALMAVAQAADPDPTRSRIRTELARGGNAALAQIASTIKADEHPAQTLNQLALALGAVNDTPGSVRLLRRARDEYPGDVWINLNLSWKLALLDPPQRQASVRYLRSALSLRPDSKYIRQRLADDLWRARDWEAAARAWEALIQVDPENAPLYGNRALALVRLGDIAGAQRTSERCVEMAPREPVPWYHLLFCLSQRADHGAYLEKAKHAAGLFKNDAAIAAHHAAALWRTEKPSEAIAKAEAAVKLNPADTVASLTLASILIERGDPDRAVTILQETMSLSAKRRRGQGDLIESVSLEHLFGYALELTGELEKQAATLVHRQNTNISDMGAIWGLAALMRLQLNYTDEMRLRSLLVRVEPHDPEGHAELGLVLRDQLQKPREAEHSFRKAVKLRSENPRYWAALAHALALQDKSAEAMKAIERAVRLDRYDHLVRRDHVHVLVQLGRHDEAREVARQAAKNAKHAGSMTSAGESLLATGDLEAALVVLLKADKLAPRYCRAQRALAAAYYRSNKLAEASAVLERALGQRRLDLRARLMLGDVRAAQGRVEDAMVQYQKAQVAQHAGGFAGEAWMRGRAKEQALRDPVAIDNLAQRATDLGPYDPAAWRARALAALLEEDGRAVVSACDTAIGLEPDDAMTAELWFLRAIAMATLGEHVDGKASLARGLEHLKKADGPPAARDELKKRAEDALRSAEAGK